jgi:hypothetical protein
VTENANCSGPYRVEARDQRKQRRLAGAVQSKQYGKGRLPDREADVVQRDPRAVAVADAVDLECRSVSEVVLFQTRRPLGSMRCSSQACDLTHKPVSGKLGRAQP